MTKLVFPSYPFKVPLSQLVKILIFAGAENKRDICFATGQTLADSFLAVTQYRSAFSINSMSFNGNEVVRLFELISLKPISNIEPTLSKHVVTACDRWSFDIQTRFRLCDVKSCLSCGLEYLV